MARTLDVYLFERLAGHLTQDDHGDISFTYAEEWLAEIDSVSLSVSMPLRTETYGRRECTGFFNGILPEEANREVIAKNVGISARNDFAMLEEIGGECAGAVTLVPAGEMLQMAESKYRPISEAELADILRTLPQRPLLAGEDGIRLSLAGAQDKIAVHVRNGTISPPWRELPVHTY